MPSTRPLVPRLDNPNVAAALMDLVSLQRWEVLRRHGGPLTASQCAELTGSPLAATQRSLDLLTEAGFTVRFKATTRNPKVTYQTAADEVLVEWNVDDPTQHRWMEIQRDEARRHVRSLIDGSFGFRPPVAPKSQFAEMYRIAMLTEGEVEQIMSILVQARCAITEIEQRAIARGRSAGAADVAAPRDPAEGACNAYVLALAFGAVPGPVLPMPRVSYVDATMLAQRVASLQSTPRSLLSTREYAIAERLAAGDSRPEIARRLGLSPNTVASHAKRIYAKLGVRSRAELATRMAALA